LPFLLFEGDSDVVGFAGEPAFQRRDRVACGCGQLIRNVVDKAGVVGAREMRLKGSDRRFDLLGKAQRGFDEAPMRDYFLLVSVVRSRWVG
jgi:hypothetical protein